MKDAAEAGDVAAMEALAAKNPRLLVEPVDSSDLAPALIIAAYEGHATGA